MARRAVGSFAKQVAATVDAASVAANTSATQNFTIAGLRVDMSVVAIDMPSLDAGLVISDAWVSAANTLTVRFGNLTGTPINPASQTMNLLLV